MTLFCVGCNDYFEVESDNANVKFGQCPECEKKDRRETPKILMAEFNPAHVDIEESEGQDPFWMEIKRGFKATATSSPLEFDEVESGDQCLPKMSPKAINDLIKGVLWSIREHEQSLKPKHARIRRSTRIFGNKPRMV